MASTDVFLTGEGYGVNEVRVSSTVIFSIVDHFSRRKQGNMRVIGTLLGRFNSDNTVDVLSSFPVPHSDDEVEVAVNIEYHRTMFELHKRVNAMEDVVGWYATGTETDTNSVIIHEFYGRECSNPVHLLVDAGLQSENADIKAFVSTAYNIDDLELSSKFRGVPANMALGRAEKVGMDVLNRTLLSAEKGSDEPSAPLSKEDELMDLERSLCRLQNVLHLITEKVNRVAAGEEPGDTEVGRYVAETLASVPKISSEFDKLVGDAMRDLLMVVYLSKLTETQLYVAENLLTIDLRV